MDNRLSIVIPTRDEAAVIGAFLAAVPASVELVVVDASDDATPEIVLGTRPHNTRVIRSRAGIAQARQIGAEAARGEWLLFSDADVRFASGYFERVGAHLVGDAFYGAKLATAAHPVYNRSFAAGQRLCHRLGFAAGSGSNMAVRRAAFAAIGGFRLDLPVNEDSELLLRMVHRGYRVAYVPELQVLSLNDRRLDRGATRKLLHSAVRCALIAAALRVPLPQRLLRHDWGYWRQPRAELRRR
jgi:glycosyltransferase involved in cell wall biosynthesis